MKVGLAFITRVCVSRKDQLWLNLLYLMAYKTHLLSLKMHRSYMQQHIDVLYLPIFSLQVVQLQELFDVRHSVFIVGSAGTGKSKVWKSLLQTHRNNKMKPLAIDLDPKAVTNDELFGIINPSTREWKDGEGIKAHSFLFSL